MTPYGSQYGRGPESGMDYVHPRADLRFGEPAGRSRRDAGGGWGWPELGRYDPTHLGGGGRDFDAEGSRWGSQQNFGGYGSPQGRAGRGAYGGGSAGFGVGTGRGGGFMGGLRSTADRTLAADIMTENPAAVTGDSTLAEVARRMRELDVGVIPVVDSPASYRLEGLITDRDITIRAVAEGKDVNTARVSDFMTRDVETVAENDTVRDVFDVMKRERVRRVPVTDHEGRLIGIIAQADLAVDYAGLDMARENEVEEVLERISEPARPRWEWEGRFSGGYDRGDGSSYDRDFGDRIRSGFHTIRRGARRLLGRGYDGEFGGYDRGWR